MHYSNTILPLFALAMVPFAATQSHAQSIRCIQDHFVADLALDDQPGSYRILENDTLAVFHQESEEIRFYDTSIEGTLTLLGSYTLYHTSDRTTIHAQGNDIYVTVPQTDEPDSNYDFIVINAQDPSNPVLHDVQTVFQNFDYADFVGNTAYFMNHAAYDKGNSVYSAYDISDPDMPSLVHRVGMGSRVDNEQGMQVSNGLLHISVGNKLKTFEINELSQLQWVGTMSFGGDRVRGMEARGQYIYLYHTGNSPEPEFEIYDYSDPANPVLVYESEVDTAFQVQLDGQYAYLIGNGISVWNILDPAAPIQTAAITEYAGTNGLLADDEHLYITRDSGISIYHKSVRTLGHPDEVITATSGEPYEMVVEGDLAYIAQGSGGVGVYDLSDPMSPQFIRAVSSTPGASDTTEVVMNSDTLFAVNSDVIEVFSLTDPTTPSLTTTIEAGLYITDIDVNDNNLVVMTHDSDSQSGFGLVLAIYDITNPSSPSILSTTSGFLSATWVELQGDQLYIYDTAIPAGFKYPGLTAFDISDPTSPVFADEVLLAQVGHAAFKDGYMFVCSDDGFAAPENTILVYDVTDPYQTTLVSEFPTGVRPSQIAIRGNDLIVEANGLYLYDITNPLQPARAGTAPSLGEFYPSPRPKPYFLGDTIVSLQPDIGLISNNAGACSTCIVDMNFDGTLDYFDVAAFLAAYSASEPLADLNHDGIYTWHDISTFLVAFSAGCP